MRTSRQELLKLLENGNIEPVNIPKSLELSEVWPSNSSWAKYLNNLLTWLGSLAIALSVIFFVAYNWGDIGRFAKFVLVQILIAAAIGAYVYFNNKELSQKVLLTVASLFTGALLALFHQTYQTGADPWQLFFTWALLITPWVIASRFSILWFIQVFLLNLTLFLYLQISTRFFGFFFGTNTSLLWLAFIMNAIILVVWEFSATRFEFLKERWPVRLIALGCGFAISFLAMLSIFEYREMNALAPCVWLLCILSIFYIYRKIKPDLFILAAACLSGIIIITTFVIVNIFDGFDEAVFLLLALMVIGLGSASAIWLRNVNKEFANA